MQVTEDDGGQGDQKEKDRGMMKGGWGGGSATTEHCGTATVELLYGNLKTNIKIKP